MRRPHKSSGDLIADRRYTYALSLAREGDVAAATDLMEQATERAPDWAPGWHALGRLRLRRFDRPGAVAAFRECLRCDPADALGASLELARLDAAVAVDAAPAAYVATLFNAYAPDFDSALLERLGYTTPRALAALARRLRPGEPAPLFARALDLGCGTGLAGEALRADVAWLEGVDLADGMLEVAREKRVYDSLQQADILAALMDEGEVYDLIAAADVFVYVGDLSRIVKTAAARLAPDGLFVFSVERADVPGDWVIGDSLRFAHSPDYLRRLAGDAGLEVAGFEPSALRRDRGRAVEGLLVALRKPAPAVNDGAPRLAEAFDVAPSADDPSPLPRWPRRPARPEPDFPA